MADRSKCEKSSESIASRFVRTIFKEDDLSAIDNRSERTIPGIHDRVEWSCSSFWAADEMKSCWRLILLLLRRNEASIEEILRRNERKKCKKTGQE